MDLFSGGPVAGDLAGHSAAGDRHLEWQRRHAPYLAKLTGTRAVTTRRQYVKAGCSEHCREKHQHVLSVSGRWSVTGAKATVVLWNTRRYIHLQTEAVQTALVVGLGTGFKPATAVRTAARMAELGWVGCPGLWLA